MQNIFKNNIELVKRVFSHPGFIKYFKNTSWLFAEKALRMTVGLFVGIWVARYLGPEQFGLLSYLQSFVALFAVIATLGLDTIVVRELVKDEDKRDILLGTAWILKLIGASVTLLLLLVAINFTSNDHYTNLLIFIIASAVIFQSFNVIDFYFQSRVLSKYVVFANMIILLISSIIKIILILQKAPLIAFVWVILFDSIILAAGLLFFYFKNEKSFLKWKFNKNIAISLMKDSWPLVLSSIVVVIYMKIDQVMIKEMIDNESVGQYAAAVKLSEAWYFIPVVINSSLFPAIIHAKKKKEKLYYNRLQNLYSLMVCLSVGVALPMTFLSDWLVTLLYGDQFYQTGGVLVIHVWSGVFVFLGVASSKWFINENLQLLSFWRTFYGMLLNIILNVILIQYIGIKGAAIATFVTSFFAAYVFDLFTKKTRYQFIMKTKSLLFFEYPLKKQDDA